MAPSTSSSGAPDTIISSRRFCATSNFFDAFSPAFTSGIKSQLDRLPLPRHLQTALIKAPFPATSYTSKRTNFQQFESELQVSATPQGVNAHRIMPYVIIL